MKYQFSALGAPSSARHCRYPLQAIRWRHSVPRQFPEVVNAMKGGEIRIMVVA
jgi:hypothetical protein